jgi:hypothetical protein
MTGVYVIDAKDWNGKITIARPLFGQPKLLQNGCDRTKALNGLDVQVARVRTALVDAGCPDITVQGAVCFTRADLPWLRTQSMRGHLLLYRRAIAKRLNAPGPLSMTRIYATARLLATAFPPA